MKPNHRLLQHPRHLLNNDRFVLNKVHLCICSHGQGRLSFGFNLIQFQQTRSESAGCRDRRQITRACPVFEVFNRTDRGYNVEKDEVLVVCVRVSVNECVCVCVNVYLCQRRQKCVCVRVRKPVAVKFSVHA